MITTLSLLVTVLGAGLAWLLFRNGTAAAPSSRPARWSPPPARNLYTDAFNEAVFEKPGIYLTRALVYLDNRGIDGLVNGLAAAVGGGSGRLRRLQTGFVRSYALSMLGGAAARGRGASCVGAGSGEHGCMTSTSRSCRVLTVAPLVGALVVALLPRSRPELAKQVALVWSLAGAGARAS